MTITDPLTIQMTSGREIQAACGGADSPSPATKFETAPALGAQRCIVAGEPNVSTAQGMPGCGSASAQTISGGAHQLVNERREEQDQILGQVAECFTDIERVRIATENRIRQLTKDTPDKDERLRGLCLPEDHEDVVRMTVTMAAMKAVEHQIGLQLKKLMRQHPLGLWVENTYGVGEQQGARLIAAIGDPYIIPEQTLPDGTVTPAGPRTVRQLWRYCGMDVVDAAAPRRQKGQRITWNPEARTRIWLIAKQMERHGSGTGCKYRDLYDTEWARQDGLTHSGPCAQCSPAGQPPAPVGSPLSDAHKRGRRLRLVAKAILEDLWKEGRRQHREELSQS